MGDLLLLLIPNRPRFGRAVLDRASSIAESAGNIALASVVLPTLFDKADPSLLLLGILLTVLSWLTSLFIANLIHD